MSTSLEKAPKWMRAAEIALGAIAIALSAWVLGNPGQATELIVIFLGIALIMIGISKIIEGAAGRHLSKGSRGIGIGIGVVSIVGGFVSIVNEPDGGDFVWRR